MDATRTEIAVVLDRSGSMESVRADTIGGYNAFLDAQVDEAGAVDVTLVQFDNEYEVVCLRKPVRVAPRLTHDSYIPRGMTALLDAIGRTMEELGARLAATPEAKRPGKVIFVIITDGAENASHHFSRERVFEMIRHQTAVYQWEFVFLAANQDAIEAGEALGIQPELAMSCADTPLATQAMYESLSSNLKLRRTGMKSSMSWEDHDRQVQLREGAQG